MPQVALPTQINENFLFHSLVVRPITSAESSDWDIIMAKHQYLGFKSLGGESIRYVAEMQGQWVALLDWLASSFPMATFASYCQ